MSTCPSTEALGSGVKTIIAEHEIGTSCLLNDPHKQRSMEINNTAVAIATESQKCYDALLKVPSLSTVRERRNVSSPLCILNEPLVDPQSPSSSSSTSQATSANDATFEPTIEMMVNDFDDEQTLNEEEALASLESQDPDDEINTLKKESEMPLEELLAKYRALPDPTPTIYPDPIRKKPKKSHKEKHKQKYKQDVCSTQSFNKNREENLTSHEDNSSKNVESNLEDLNAESGHESTLLKEENGTDSYEQSSNMVLTTRKHFSPSIYEERKEPIDNSIIQPEISKLRRSHLLDLYPEGTFDNVVNDAIAGNGKETIYGVEDDEEDEIEEEDEDYKKKVMIGTSYQATIPIGLSQYGDILPYENEDKLIWEPCQVSEREVEEYLIKIRDIKSNQQNEEDDHSSSDIDPETQSKESSRSENNVGNIVNKSILASEETLIVDTSVAMDTDNHAIIKDNEQALHLLVQCGYDFKEALRRKRLNALPLNDCMSLWSEEECHKFEEGIQKYGKDFLKIRQNQVRTRTMRELVQFYYLWKKSERRDQNFANADTVDQMDIYLNEENEFGSSSTSAVTPLGSPISNTSNCTGTVRNNSSQKNISIMATTSTAQTVTNLNSEKSTSKICLQQQQTHHKRRTHICNQPTFIVASDFNSENYTNVLTNSAK